MKTNYVKKNETLLSLMMTVPADGISRKSSFFIAGGNE